MGSKVPALPARGRGLLLLLGCSRRCPRAPPLASSGVQAAEIPHHQRLQQQHHERRQQRRVRAPRQPPGARRRHHLPRRPGASGVPEHPGARSIPGAPRSGPAAVARARRCSSSCSSPPPPPPPFPLLPPPPPPPPRRGVFRRAGTRTSPGGGEGGRRARGGRGGGAARARGHDERRELALRDSPSLRPGFPPHPPASEAGVRVTRPGEGAIRDPGLEQRAGPGGGAEGSVGRRR